MQQNDNKIYSAINLEWAATNSVNNIFKNCIALVDTSGSMENNDMDGHVPLNAAIGLGLRIAEGSSLGRRILTFSSKPSWLNLEDCAKVTDMVDKILSTETFGLNCNILSAMEMIAEACETQEMLPSHVKDLTLVVLSDMEFDKSGLDYKTKHHDEIINIFKAAGERSTHKKPYPIPHIIYWNMRTSYSKNKQVPSLPVVSTAENVTLLSGYNSVLLNALADTGVSVLESCTPWSSLSCQLKNPRYSWTNNAIKTAFSYEKPKTEICNSVISQSAGWWW